MTTPGGLANAAARSAWAGYCRAFGRRPVVRLLDRVDQLVLVHLRAALDVEPTGEVLQVLLARVRVDAPGRRQVAAAVTAGRLLVGRTVLGLGLPVVAHLLVGVLERGERGAVRALALAVAVDGGVVRLGP